MKVLIVEDDDLFAKSIEVVLRRHTRTVLQVEHVRSVADAKNSLTRKNLDFDIVLLDLSLPDCSGIETLKQIRKEAVGVAIVVLTGHSDSALGIQAVKDGAQDYLVKGQLDGASILRAMEYAIERAKFVADREDFVATLTHDLKNPLVGCDRLMGHLIETDMDRDEQKSLLTHMRASNRAILSMMENLLEIYRFDKSLEQLTLENTNLVNLATCCIEECKPVAAIHGINIQSQTEDDQISVLADEYSIKRVLQNLLDNAIKYSSSGGVIVVKVTSLEDSAKLEVINSGQRLSDDDLKNLFNRFWRADPTRTKDVGTGLGLHHCRQLVERHKGTIECHNSSDGLNTVFSVSLPKI